MVTDDEWILPGPEPVTVGFAAPAHLRDDERRAYSHLVPTIKMVLLRIYRLGLKPRTVRAYGQVLRGFAVFLAQRTPPIGALAEVQPHLVEEFLAQRIARAAKPVGPAIPGRHRSILHLLFRHRRAVEDRLPFDPMRSGGGATICRRAMMARPATPFIPDDILREYLRVALDIIDNQSADVLARLRKQARWTPVRGKTPLRRLPGNSCGRPGRAVIAAGRRRVSGALRRFERGRLRRLPAGARLTQHHLAIEAEVPPGFLFWGARDVREKVSRRLEELTAARGLPDFRCLDPPIHRVNDVQTACFIIVAISTGMRVSELAAMEPGCVRDEKRTDGPSILWIDSRLFKTSSLPMGERRSWICGALAARAVGVLESLVRELPTTCATRRRGIALPGTLCRTYRREGGGVVSRPCAPPTMENQLSAFARDHGLRRVTWRQFRRSFARNVVRHTSTPIEALREHFKHASLCMTDWYLGYDVDLFESIAVERLDLSFEVLDRGLRGVAGGPGGVRLGESVRERIRAGQLPRTFLGRAGDEYRQALIRELHESGFYAHPCGEFTFCVFVREHSPCGGVEAPIPHRCHPTTCSSSHIDFTNLPFFERRIAHAERQLDELRSAGQGASPLATFLAGQVERDRQAIAPIKAAP